jgi:hypothetical protein
VTVIDEFFDDAGPEVPGRASDEDLHSQDLVNVEIWLWGNVWVCRLVEQAVRVSDGDF